MLSKEERLKQKSLFNAAFSLGKEKKQKLSSDLLSLYYLKRKKDINKLTTRSNKAKAAFVVGLKIDKRATKRNLIRRRMISAYRLLTRNSNNEQNQRKFLAFIWVANPAIKNATFDEIKNSIEGLLNRLKKQES